MVKLYDSSVFLCRESSGYTEHTSRCITGNWLNQTNHFGHLLDLKGSTKEPVLVLDAALWFDRCLSLSCTHLMFPISMTLPITTLCKCTFTYTLLFQFLALFNLKMSNRHISFLLHYCKWKLVLPLWFSNPYESPLNLWWTAALRKESSSHNFGEFFKIWNVLKKRNKHRLKNQHSHSLSENETFEQHFLWVLWTPLSYCLFGFLEWYICKAWVYAHFDV